MRKENKLSDFKLIFVTINVTKICSVMKKLVFTKQQFHIQVTADNIFKLSCVIHFNLPLEFIVRLKDSIILFNGSVCWLWQLYKIIYIYNIYAKITLGKGKILKSFTVSSYYKEM